MQVRNSQRLCGFNGFGVAILCCLVGLAATSANANVVGYGQVNNFAPSYIGFTGGGGLQTTEGAVYSAGTPSAPAESSATWTFGSPTNVRSLVIFPNATAINVSPQDYNFTISQNGSPVYSGTIPITGTDSNFKPTIVNQTMLGTTTLKTQTTDLTRTACCGFDEVRDIVPTLAFSEAMGPLVSPTSVSSDVGWNNLNLTIDNTKNVAITTLGAPVGNAYVTFNFGSPRTLSGVMVNINPIDDPTAFAWHTWNLKTAPGGTVLATKGASTDRYQFLEFAGGPQTLTSITLEGPMNPDTGSSGRGRLGELWGVDALVPSLAGSPSTVNLGGALEFTSILGNDVVQVSNVGAVGSRLDINSYSITGPDAARFSLVGFAPQALRVGETSSALFDVQFSALAAIANYSAVLTFQTNVGNISFNLNAQSDPIPEPASGLALFCLAGLLCKARRKR